MTESELGHLAAVDDERSDGIGLWSERSLVDPRLAELIGNFEHLVERVAQVCLNGRGAEFHADTVSKAWITRITADRWASSASECGRAY